jgi:hypothetical protein
MNFFKNLFKKKEEKQTVQNNVEEQESVKSLSKIVLEHRKKYQKQKYKSKETCEIDGHTFKIGDKVICRTNEPYPLIVGKITEFWDNKGKWDKIVPVVRNSRTGKKFNVHGIIKPYTNELMDTLRSMKPLEQWNYFVPEDVRYTEEEMRKKEEAFEKREKFSLSKK